MFKTYPHVEAIDLLIRFKRTKCFLLNTINTDKNDINGQNTYTAHRENDNLIAK